MTNDLAMSADLAAHRPNNCDDFFALYNKTLKSLLDKHAPLRQTCSYSSAPWFNAECRRIKAKTQRLEKIYLSIAAPTMLDGGGANNSLYSLQRSRNFTLTTVIIRLQTTHNCLQLSSWQT